MNFVNSYPSSSALDEDPYEAEAKGLIGTIQEANPTINRTKLEAAVSAERPGLTKAVIAAALTNLHEGKLAESHVLGKLILPLRSILDRLHHDPFAVTGYAQVDMAVIRSILSGYGVTKAAACKSMRWPSPVLRCLVSGAMATVSRSQHEAWVRLEAHLRETGKLPVPPKRPKFEAPEEDPQESPTELMEQIQLENPLFSEELAITTIKHRTRLAAHLIRECFNLDVEYQSREVWQKVIVVLKGILTGLKSDPFHVIGVSPLDTTDLRDLLDELDIDPQDFCGKLPWKWAQFAEDVAAGREIKVDHRQFGAYEKHLIKLRLQRDKQNDKQTGKKPIPVSAARVTSSSEAEQWWEQYASKETSEFPWGWTGSSSQGGTKWYRFNPPEEDGALGGVRRGRKLR
ncbi:hypothetical protein HN748_03700 [Candidatus Peregrinibacteria bacterium]|jgi:hypothetical protein|nr:hypothetical protein [Candidatus Peregrinibacteria bacterium]MBT7484595.1 hypothetical protein [Candidatus Peregrinibacteria bacterium]MBT7703313.1 hypothetical protein [Candidatus Peregrinibacteria bacterium]